jgi:hypothetical protein
MPYTSFHAYFPEIAKKETRTMTTLKQNDDIPKGSYGLLEMYCDDPGCDCQRVFFEVFDWERQKSMAYIAYGWESAKFYRKWLGMDNPQTIQELQGPILNPGSPQSDLAPAFLNLVSDLVLQDSSYIERLKRHYWMFKEKIDPEHFHVSSLQKQPAPVELPASKKTSSRRRHRSSWTDN